MAFSDSLTITINSVAKTLVRINQDGYSSEYFLRESTGEYRLKIRNASFVSKSTQSTTDRHNVEFTQTVYATATTPSIVRKVYSVIEVGRTDAVTDPLNFTLGFVAFFTSANITKLLNYES